MNCYYCNQQHPGGTRFGNQPAIGVCQHCGVGICTEHSVKAAEPGSPLLCDECARLLIATPQKHQLQTPALNVAD